MKQENIELNGEVTQALGNTNFRVTLDNGMELICTISGKIRKNYIRIMPGDKVKVEVSPYDITKGRITRRENTIKPTVNPSINNKKSKK
jgi:translation initiation factor IF-1